MTCHDIQPLPRAAPSSTPSAPVHVICPSSGTKPGHRQAESRSAATHEDYGASSFSCGGARFALARGVGAPIAFVVFGP